MKILQVIGRMGRGGIETWLLNVLRNIDRDRYHFDFLPQSPGPQPLEEEIRELGGRLLPTVPASRILAHRRHLLNVLRTEGPYQVVHAHGTSSVGFALRCAARLGVPVRIAHSHSTRLRGRNRRLRSYVYEAFTRRWMLKYATVGLGCSQPAAAALFGADWQADPRFGVLYCGVDFSPFRAPNQSRDSIRDSWGVPPEARVVGHVGRFMEAKNHGFLLEVAAAVTKANPETYFVLVGDGHLRPQIENDIQRLGLRDRVILCGESSNVPALMHAMDVFVLPSLYEGLPLVLMEAQSAGLRCVVGADNIPTEADVIKEHIRRVPLSAGVEAWREAISQLLSMPRPDGEEAWARLANSQFSIENSTANLAQVYDTGRLPK